MYLDIVLVLKTFKSKNEQLGVMLVAEGWEGNRRKSARLEPVNGGGVDGDGLLGGDVGTVLEVVVLAFLLGLEVETGEATEVLAADSLIDGGATLDAFTVEMRRVGPPVRLHLHVAQDHVLNGYGQTGNLEVKGARIEKK